MAGSQQYYSTAVVTHHVMYVYAYHTLLVTMSDMGYKQNYLQASDVLCCISQAAWVSRSASTGN